MDLGGWRRLLESVDTSEQQHLKSSLKSLLQLSLEIRNRLTSLRLVSLTTITYLLWCPYRQDVTQADVDRFSRVFTALLPTAEYMSRMPEVQWSIWRFFGCSRWYKWWQLHLMGNIFATTSGWSIAMLKACRHTPVFANCQCWACVLSFESRMQLPWGASIRIIDKISSFTRWSCQEENLLYSSFQVYSKVVDMNSFFYDVISSPCGRSHTHIWRESMRSLMGGDRVGIDWILGAVITMQRLCDLCG